jgi:glyceraldehyde-3-phosphate dehydrogenase (NADP+)
MRFSTLCISTIVLLVSTHQSIWVHGSASVTDDASSSSSSSCTSSSTKRSPQPPFVVPKLMIHGKIITKGDTDDNDNDVVALSSILLEDVHGCCTVTEEGPSSSTVFDRPVIGKMVQMSKDQITDVLTDAEKAWDGGSGTWPQMSLRERLIAIEKLLSELELNQREKMVEVLMWEIGKNRIDAESEFDRTIAFGRQVMRVIRGTTTSTIPSDGTDNDSSFGGSWQSIGSTMAFIRRAAVGIVLCLGPMNYPLNETYATLIPALLMGNVVVMKIPTVGGLVHLLTMEAFQKALPPGAMNFISGRGRDSMPLLMQSGKIDALAFIGGSGAADELIKQHPHPHRLKVFLQLEAKNMGIFLPDMFQSSKSAELSKALDESVLGGLSFNGQRCTALKLFFIPKGHGSIFAERIAQRVDAMHVGLPWQTWEGVDGGVVFSHITPLPAKKRTELMKKLINDAVSKGAKIMNRGGGTIIGGSESTLMIPAVLYPVTHDMDIYYEEQFGPIVAITEYDTLDTVLAYGQYGQYGQQVSIFVSDEETTAAANLLDKFSTVFGKININSQCGRSPDTLPFSGRRSSAMGVMSVTDALKEFSIPTVVSYKDSDINTVILQEIEAASTFLQPL